MGAVRYEERGAVAVITLDRPASLNAFDTELRLGVKAAVERAAEATAVRALVLTGAGRGFSAGAELKSDGARAGGLPSPDEAERQLAQEYAPAILALAAVPKPVVAAVHGFATGIALGFVLACDLVVMGEGAFVQVPFGRLGLVPDGGLTWQLATRLGHQRAFELAAGAERLSAARCLEWGIANRLVPDERVTQSAVEWAAQLAQGPALALALTKQLLRQVPSHGLAEAIRAEAQAQRACAAAADFAEGVAAFREKRPPRFER
jgi:2-(1,2-epoxy-1,2-dihydrophenyl)acetyl-CoA isomerase